MLRIPVATAALALASCGAGERKAAPGTTTAAQVAASSTVLSAAATAPAGADPTGVVGPWGELFVDDITVEPPPASLSPSLCSTVPPVWTLPVPGSGPARLDGLFDMARLRPETRAALLDRARCSDKACELHPDLALIRGLDGGERDRLYAQLARYPENALLHSPLRYPPGALLARMADHKLPEATRTLASHLLWHGSDGQEALSDFEPLCDSLTAPADRLGLMKLLTRARGTLATLRVRPGADVEALSRYWSRGAARDSELASLLESLAQKPVGGSVDIVHLLPAFPRTHVNTYAPSDQSSWSCHYSSFNFDAPRPDETLTDMRRVEQVLHDEYRRLRPDEALQLGDLILYAGPDKALKHSVVYIAADLVFTKNGMSSLKPWVFMRRGDVEALFGSPTAHLFRRKSAQP